jgi:hypothetical protein
VHIEEAAVSDPCRRFDCPHEELHQAGSCKGVLRGQANSNSAEESLSVQAVRWRREHGETAIAAAAKFGLSRDLIRTTERRLFPPTAADGVQP